MGSAQISRQAPGDKDTQLRVTLTALRKLLADTPPPSAAALLKDPTVQAAMMSAGLAHSDGSGLPEVTALAALAEVMTPASARAFQPAFNGAVVVLFASLDGNGDMKLNEEEWCGFYRAAQALSLFSFSPPAGCENESSWHEDNAQALYADIAGAAGLDLSDFGAWCRRHLDRGQVFRWYHGVKKSQEHLKREKQPYMGPQAGGLAPR